VSLVMSIFTEDFIVMSGDHRRIHVEDESNFFDDTPKIFKVNDRVLIGLAGDVSASIWLSKVMKVKSRSSMDYVTKHISKMYRKLQEKQPDVYASAHISGIGDSGKVKYASLSHEDNFKAHYIIPAPGEIKWQYSFHKVNPGELIECLYEDIKEVSPETIGKLLSEVNSEVGKNDVGVSKVCDIRSIHR
jgi:hypothetical protein